MLRINFLLLACLMFAFCQSEQQPQQAQSQQLQKVYYKSEQEVQKLRDAGAEIIVQQPDYVIIKTGKMVATQDIKSEPIKELDMIQRLVKIYVKDSTDLQTVVNSGIDLWEVKNDTAIARAYDIYIDALRKAGLSVEIIAQDASKREEK
jgi:DNA-binding ferritin-like protein